MDQDAQHVPLLVAGTQVTAASLMKHSTLPGGRRRRGGLSGRLAADDPYRSRDPYMPHGSHRPYGVINVPCDTARTVRLKVSFSGPVISGRRRSLVKSRTKDRQFDGYSPARAIYLQVLTITITRDDCIQLSVQVHRDRFTVTARTRPTKRTT